MDKSIESKLNKMSKEELISAIRSLCDIPEVTKALKLLVMPDKKAVERELRAFERWCESVANDPCSPRAFDGMYTSASLLWNAVGVLDTVSAARILYKMYVATEEILEFSEDAVDIHYNCRDQLVYIINENGDAFSEGDMENYKDIIDEVADE